MPSRGWSLWPPLILEWKISSSGHPAVHWCHLKWSQNLGVHTRISALPSPIGTPTATPLTKPPVFGLYPAPHLRPSTQLQKRNNSQLGWSSQLGKAGSCNWGFGGPGRTGQDYFFLPVSGVLSSLILNPWVNSRWCFWLQSWYWTEPMSCPNGLGQDESDFTAEFPSGCWCQAFQKIEEQGNQFCCK